MGEPSVSHLNAGGEVHMVEVGDRASTERCATAEGCIAMQPEVLELVLQQRAPKGDVLAVARIAAIQAAKRTWEHARDMLADASYDLVVLDELI